MYAKTTRRCRFHYNLTHTKNRKKTLSYQITITIFRLFCFKVYDEYSTTTVQHYYIKSWINRVLIIKMVKTAHSDVAMYTIFKISCLK